MMKNNVYHLYFPETRSSFSLNFIGASRYADQSQHVFKLDDYSNCTFVQALPETRRDAMVGTVTPPCFRLPLAVVLQYARSLAIPIELNCYGA
jgi:hypothetical protein